MRTADYSGFGRSIACEYRLKSQVGKSKMQLLDHAEVITISWFVS